MSDEMALLGSPKPYAVARQVAVRYGIDLPEHVAAAVAAAVLECADGERRVSAEITEYLWGHPDAMKALDRNLRRQMADELVEAELLPTALPRQVVTKSPHPWEPVKVELVVPVREPVRR